MIRVIFIMLALTLTICGGQCFGKQFACNNTCCDNPSTYTCCEASSTCVVKAEFGSCCASAKGYCNATQPKCCPSDVLGRSVCVGALETCCAKSLGCEPGAQCCQPANKAPFCCRGVCCGGQCFQNKSGTCCGDRSNFPTLCQSSEECCTATGYPVCIPKDTLCCAGTKYFGGPGYCSGTDSACCNLGGNSAHCYNKDSQACCPIFSGNVLCPPHHTCCSNANQTFPPRKPCQAPGQQCCTALNNAHQEEPYQVCNTTQSCCYPSCCDAGKYCCNPSNKVVAGSRGAPKDSCAGENDFCCPNQSTGFSEVCPVGTLCCPQSGCCHGSTTGKCYDGKCPFGDEESSGSLNGKCAGNEC